MKDDQKKNKKVRKRAKKNMKDIDNATDLTEVLGANENTGNLQAEDK